MFLDLKLGKYGLLRRLLHFDEVAIYLLRSLPSRRSGDSHRVESKSVYQSWSCSKSWEGEIRRKRIAAIAIAVQL
jgi:hypothetical protein